MRLGFYYSQAQDWNNRGGAAAGGHWDSAQDGLMDDYVRTIAGPQVREILSHYGLVSYTVKKGDTPAKIAQKLLGDSQRWPEVMAVNPGLEPDKLQPDDVIFVPKR